MIESYDAVATERTCFGVWWSGVAVVMVIAVPIAAAAAAAAEWRIITYQLRLTEKRGRVARQHSQHLVGWAKDGTGQMAQQSTAQRGRSF